MRGTISIRDRSGKRGNPRNDLDRRRDESFAHLILAGKYCTSLTTPTRIVTFTLGRGSGNGDEFRKVCGKIAFMIALKAHFDGKVLVPDEPLNLPLNQKVRIEL